MVRRKLQFPEGFMWGCATAAYQIEGAVNEGGRGESIWDRYSHTPDKVLNGDTGDIACDHYHRYVEDVKLMKDIGINAYRFSIAWSRIIPSGKGLINRKGIDFYNKLIDALLEKDIEPVVTIYHFDLPQALEDMGGWANRDIAYYFSDYAEVLFKNYGDRVKFWITENEPICVSYGYYPGVGWETAPGVKDINKMVSSIHHLLLAHGLAVRKYRESLNGTGKIGIAINIEPVYPNSQNPDDLKSAKLDDAFLNRMFLDPLFYGRYPVELQEIFGRDLEISKEDKEIIASPFDFLGVNYYTRKISKYNPNGGFLKSSVVKPKEADYTDMGWEIFPQGLYDILIRIKNEYRNPVIYITESGCAINDKLENGKISDLKRIAYLKGHFKMAHKAISDGVKIKGYFVWSLMDNFEWTFGRSKRFGMVYVDYPTQKRIPKESARWYSKVIEKNFIID